MQRTIMHLDIFENYIIYMELRYSITDKCQDMRTERRITACSVTFGKHATSWICILLTNIRIGTILRGQIIAIVSCNKRHLPNIRHLTD